MNNDQLYEITCKPASQPDSMGCARKGGRLRCGVPTDRQQRLEQSISILVFRIFNNRLQPFWQLFNWDLRELRLEKLWQCYVDKFVKLWCHQIAVGPRPTESNWRCVCGGESIARQHTNHSSLIRSLRRCKRGGGTSNCGRTRAEHETEKLHHHVLGYHYSSTFM